MSNERAENISKAEARELQDVLRTLTDSGTALLTSARELVAKWESQKSQILTLQSALADKDRELGELNRRFSQSLARIQIIAENDHEPDRIEAEPTIAEQRVRSLRDAFRLERTAREEAERRLDDIRHLTTRDTFSTENVLSIINELPPANAEKVS